MRIIVFIIVGLLLTSCSKDKISKPEPEGIIVNENINSIDIEYHKSIKLEAKVLPKEASQKIKYVSADENIIKIDENGNILANDLGSTTLILIAENTFTKSISINVHIPGGKHLSLNGKSYTLPIISNSAIQTKEELVKMLQIVEEEHPDENTEILKIEKIREKYNIAFSSISYIYKTKDKKLDQINFEYELRDDLSLEEQKKLGKAMLNNNRISFQ
ncbi:hypothetical protein E0494_04465 [Marinilabiliaceae bacterium JC040]|nr:hypothetical protein [Marinilabiliaceae bacterium JC040]